MFDLLGGRSVELAIGFRGGLEPLLVALTLLLMLSVLLEEQPSLLQGRVRLAAPQEEPADHSAEVLHVGAAVPLVEAELVAEQLVLLLEDGDQGERI